MTRGLVTDQSANDRHTSIDQPAVMRTISLTTDVVLPGLGIESPAENKDIHGCLSAC